MNILNMIPPQNQKIDGLNDQEKQVILSEL